MKNRAGLDAGKNLWGTQAGGGDFFSNKIRGAKPFFEKTLGGGDFFRKN